MSSVNAVNPNKVGGSAEQSIDPNHTTATSSTTGTSSASPASIVLGGTLPPGQLSLLTGLNFFGGLTGQESAHSSFGPAVDGNVSSGRLATLDSAAGSKNLTPTTKLVEIASSKPEQVGSSSVLLGGIVAPNSSGNGRTSVGNTSDGANGSVTPNPSSTSSLASLAQGLIETAKGGFGYDSAGTSNHNGVRVPADAAGVLNKATASLLDPKLLATDGDSAAGSGRSQNGHGQSINGDKQAVNLNTLVGDGKSVESLKGKDVENGNVTNIKSNGIAQESAEKGISKEASVVKFTSEMVDGSRMAQGVVVDPKTRERLAQDNKGPHSFFVAHNQKDGNSGQQQNKDQDQEESENKEAASRVSNDDLKNSSPVEKFNQGLRSMSTEERGRLSKELKTIKSDLSILKREFDRQIEKGASSRELTRTADRVRDTVSRVDGAFASFGAFETLAGTDNSTILGGYWWGPINPPQIPPVPTAPTPPDENATEAERLAYTAALANYQFAINSIQSAILNFYDMLNGLLTSTDNTIDSMNQNLAQA